MKFLIIRYITGWKKINMEVQLHIFLTSALHVGERSVSRFRRFIHIISWSGKDKKVKLSLRIIYWVGRAPPFFASTKYGGEWSASRPGLFAPPRHPMDRRLAGWASETV
jgi:hypothetical protein